MASEEEREVVRVKVKKCDGALPVEFRSFAVDPQITSLEVLQHILIRAFDLNGRHNFGISFLSRDRNGTEMYLSLASDWDLDVAFLSAAKPYLQLKMDIKSSEESPVMEDWDIISTKDVIGSEQHLVERTKTLASAALPFTQSILSQVGRTLSRVQQALSWSYEEEMKPFMPPLSDAEFHSFLNGQGQLTRPEELRLRIYHGGVEPSLRKVVWRYLLNVYPNGLSGQERMDYMKRKTREYEQLKREWRTHVSLEDLEFIRGNVLKDVLRTDRSHPYYAGSEDSPHLAALTDLLTTFAITHPQISYCQGMSDIASPILAVMDNEAHAFICFCGIMKRLGGNFRPDGQLMSLKFQHLKLLLQYSDPEFYSYLVSRGADDLFFCYRWLLLELKREFAFDDALRMLEITWSSLPPDPPETEVELLGPPSEVAEIVLCRGKDKEVEKCLEDDNEQKTKEHMRHMLRPLREDFDKSKKSACDDAGSQSQNSENHTPPTPIKKANVTNPFERQTSFGEFKYYTTRNEDSLDVEKGQQSQSSVTSKSVTARTSRQSTIDSDDDPGEKTPLIRNCENGSSPASSPLFRVGLPVWKMGPAHSSVSSPSPLSWPECSPKSPAQPTSRGSETFPRTVPKVWTSSAHVLSSTGMYLPTVPTIKKSESLCYTQHHSQVSSPVSSFGKGQSMPGVPNASKSESSLMKSCSLPPPQEFGKGNPFMLFLCLSILLEHRDHIIKNCLDYNELAMHFDRLVRRHNLSRVLQRAKALFADYLQSEIWDSEEGDEVGSDSPTSAALHSASPISDRPIHSPLSSPLPSSPCSTYNLATTIPSTAAQVCYSSTL